MEANGVYYGLVEAQNLRMKDEDQNKLEEDDTSGSMRQAYVVQVNRVFSFLEIPAFSRMRSLSEPRPHGNEASTDDKQTDKKIDKKDETVEVILFIFSYSEYHPLIL